MFRAIIHVNEENRHDYKRHITLYTEARPTIEQANEMFDRMKAILGDKMTGGDLEQEVPGIGWVVADEVETAIICRNRQLSDQEMLEDQDEV